ncbi:MAG: alginate export family protein [Acidiferrobacterales bacterium]
MKVLLAERNYVYSARHTPLRTHQPIGRAYIRTLGSFSLLVVGLTSASAAGDIAKYPRIRGHGSSLHYGTTHVDPSEARATCLSRPAAPVRSPPTTIDPALDCPDTDTLAITRRLPETFQSGDDEVEPHVLVVRAESRERRRARPGEEEGAEADLEPSAEPGLEFEGEFEFKVDWLENIALGQRSRDDLRESEQEVQLGLSYRREQFLAFGEIKFVADQVVFSDETPRISEEAIERGETWLLFRRISDSGYSVQIGRQNFIEPRLWWWDEDLDAVRLYYAREPWRLYVGLAEEVARVSTNEDFIDPEQEDVRRLLGHVNWASSEKFNLGGFFLHQRDNSDVPPIDSVVETVRIDESDADLTWAGLRATGRLGLSRAGTLIYRADAAVVSGDEILVEFEDDVPGLSRATGIQKQDVRGWAVDVGVGWTLPLPREPILKLTYDYGSGDKDLNDDTDRTFRQTGLQDKDEEFRDYGVVLRPELSNLRIATVALALPIHTGTRLTLGYHRFRQVDPAPFLRGSALDIEPTGESKDIGDEISLVVELRKWEDLEMDIIAGSVKAGRAYGAAAGQRSNRLFFKVIYEF